MSLELRRFRFHVDHYYHLAEIGILSPEDRVELSRGEIIKKEPQSSHHASCIMRLNHLINPKTNSKSILRIRGPIRIDQYSEPEPDLSLLNYQSDYYVKSHPQPKDVFLIIEVADFELTYDEQTKLPLYAEANIPEVWLVNLNENVIEIYRKPDGNNYQEIQQYQRQDEITVPSLELSLKVEQVLG